MGRHRGGVGRARPGGAHRDRVRPRQGCAGAHPPQPRPESRATGVHMSLHGTTPDDPFEVLHARGVTDGLPVVPPTASRVTAAVEATGRGRDELIGLVAPRLGRATVEKIAVNAVMAGCRPEYVPTVIAGVEAILGRDVALCGVLGHSSAVDR